jgi:hypothetical protein
MIMLLSRAVQRTLSVPTSVGPSRNCGQLVRAPGEFVVFDVNYVAMST